LTIVPVIVPLKSKACSESIINPFELLNAFVATLTSLKAAKLAQNEEEFMAKYNHCPKCNR